MALLLASLLAPLVAFGRFPSQDGPAHLENAANLLRYGDPSAEPLREFLVVNKRPEPTWLGHLALAAWLLFLPPAVAEKVFVGLCVLALPLAFAYAARGLRRESSSTADWGAALAASPFAWSYLLHMGFYSFCWSLVCFLAALGYWLRRQAWSVGQGVVFALLALLVWALHPLTAVLLGVAVTAIGLWELLLAAREPRREESPPAWRGLVRERLAPGLLALLPAAGLAIAYAARSSGGRVEHLPTAILGRILLRLDALVAWGGGERPLAAAAAVGLLLGGGLAVAARLRRGGRDRGDGLLLLALAIAGGYFWAPNRVGEASWISHRLALVAWIVWVLWLAAQSWPRWATQAFRGACAVLAFALLAVRWPGFARLDVQLEEYLSAGVAIPDGATFLPIALAPRGIGEAGRPLSQKVQPFLHAAGFLAAERPLVDLGNYEARSGLFPLVFRPALDPYRHLASPAAMEVIPPRLNFERYEAVTGKRIEYLLLWGSPDALPSSPPQAAFVAALRGRYDLVRLSEPGGFARVYRRKP